MSLIPRQGGCRVGDESSAEMVDRPVGDRWERVKADVARLGIEHAAFDERLRHDDVAVLRVLDDGCGNGE